MLQIAYGTLITAFPACLPTPNIQKSELLLQTQTSYQSTGGGEVEAVGWGRGGVRGMVWDGWSGVNGKVDNGMWIWEYSLKYVGSTGRDVYGGIDRGVKFISKCSCIYG